METAMEDQHVTGCNRLASDWILWAHFPHDTDWSVSSYKMVAEMNTAEGVIAIAETLPDTLVKNCMLFLMREGIQPIWEDPANRDGGCFSYKVQNKDVPSTWKNLMYAVTGESVTYDRALLESVNGITLSPKKNFCIIKIWLKNCHHQNPRQINDTIGLSWKGCIFKKQTPEY